MILWVLKILTSYIKCINIMYLKFICVSTYLKLFTYVDTLVCGFSSTVVTWKGQLG